MEVVTDRSHIRGNSLTISRFKKLLQHLIVEDFLPMLPLEKNLSSAKKSCLICPHGPYYHAYWKDENGKLKKEYIGSKFDDSWKEPVNMRD